ncbi:MAG: hypothetical protein AAF809_05755 [Bacteroidota bacterium]
MMLLRRASILLLLVFAGAAGTRAQTAAVSDSAQASDTTQVEARGVQVETQRVQVVSSQRSRVYHLRHCHNARRIARHNLMVHPNAASAVRLGKRPCRVCHPPRVPPEAREDDPARR